MLLPQQSATYQNLLLGIYFWREDRKTQILFEPFDDCGQILSEKAPSNMRHISDLCMDAQVPRLFGFTTLVAIDDTSGIVVLRGWRRMPVCFARLSFQEVMAMAIGFISVAVPAYAINSLSSPF